MRFRRHKRGRFHRPVRLLQQLEERIVLDAAVDPATQEQPAPSADPSLNTQAADQLLTAAASSPEGAPPPALAKIPDNFNQVFSQPPNEVLISNSLDDIASISSGSLGDAGGAATVLVVSSSVNGADTLAAAAQEDVLVVRYDGSNDTLATLLASIESALGGQKADSIAFATHDLGQGGFHLVGSHAVNLNSLLSSSEQQSFWQGVGGLLDSDGRIDLLSCGLAGTDQGGLLVATLENITGHNVAASNDTTGNRALWGGLGSGNRQR